VEDWVEFLVGVVCGLSIAGLLWIVIAPSRRARAETGMDPDVEAQLLLGEIPSDEEDAEPTSPVEHPRAYDPKELQELRQLGQQQRRRSKSRRR
jgi:hypothetical protein